MGSKKGKANKHRTKELELKAVKEVLNGPSPIKLFKLNELRGEMPLAYYSIFKARRQTFSAARRRSSLLIRPSLRAS